MACEANLKKNADRRQQDGENDLDGICGGDSHTSAPDFESYGVPKPGEIQIKAC
jgi:hypothetical protein